MPFAFARSDRSVEAAVRRIAGRELDRAIAALDAAPVPAPAAVHAIRKRIKKLRGLLRLVQPVFNDFPAANAALRDAGRHLSGQRDAAVRIATFGRLTAADATLAPEERAAFRAALDAAGPETRDSAGEAAAARNILAALRAEAGGWRIAGKEFDALAPGLERTWARAQAAQTGAQAARGGDFAAEPFHEWRKRVKAHWYQARLLSPIWPEMMAPHVAAADALGEMLGDHNDIAVLLDDLAATEAALTRPAAFARFEARAKAERARLADRALVEGTRLFAGSGKALARRWGVWWAVWRAR
jgi:CHAD domain-containing protein